MHCAFNIKEVPIKNESSDDDLETLADEMMQPNTNTNVHKFYILEK